MRASRFTAVLAAVVPLGALASCEVLVGVADRSVAVDASEGEAATAGDEAGVDRDAAGADVEAAADADAAAPDVACFGSVALVTSLSSPTSWEWSVRFTSNGLGAYLTRAAQPPDDLRTADVLFATRGTPTGTFGAFAATSFARNDVGDLNATETGDALTVYFDTYLHADPCPNCRHVWRARRGTPGGVWAPAEQVIASPDNEDFEPYALADGSAVYFVTSRDGRAYDLWRAAAGAAFAMAPVDGDQLNLAFEPERAPVVTPDDRTLYFSRSVPPYTMFVATRADVSSPFSAPRALVMKESPAPAAHDELPTWVSADGCDLYFRDDRSGDFDLWRARRCDCP